MNVSGMGLEWAQNCIETLVVPGNGSGSPQHTNPVCLMVLMLSFSSHELRLLSIPVLSTTMEN